MNKFSAYFFVISYLKFFVLIYQSNEIFIPVCILLKTLFKIFLSIYQGKIKDKRPNELLVKKIWNLSLLTKNQNLFFRIKRNLNKTQINSIIKFKVSKSFYFDAKTEIIRKTKNYFVGSVGLISNHFSMEKLTYSIHTPTQFYYIIKNEGNT